MIYVQTKGDYHVGQAGDFLLLDAFNQPIEAVYGEIIQLMEGTNSLYAMIRTERGLRPGRLAPVQDQPL
jgi:hypothetical protein